MIVVQDIIDTLQAPGTTSYLGQRMTIPQSSITQQPLVYIYIDSWIYKTNVSWKWNVAHTNKIVILSCNNEYDPNQPYSINNIYHILYLGKPLKRYFQYELTFYIEVWTPEYIDK